MPVSLRTQQSPFERAVREGSGPPTSVVATEVIDGIPAPSPRGGPRSVQTVGGPRQAGAWVPEFLGYLMRGSSVRQAIKLSRVTESTVFYRRDNHPEFWEAWCAAAEIGTELLEQEAQRRAYHGTLKPVYQKGVRVGYERRYSDSLLMFLLKKRDPTYRDGSGSVTVNNVNSATLNVFAAIESDMAVIEGRTDGPEVDRAGAGDVPADGAAQPVDAAQPVRTEAEPAAD